MPKLDISNLNYVVVGDKEKILNIDFVDSNGILCSNVTFFTDSDTRGEPSYSESIGGLAHFYSVSSDTGSLSGSETLFRNINAYGFSFSENPNEATHALYDAKDVALKSAVAMRIQNRAMSEVSNNGIDMYFPHLLKNPLGFVQKQAFSYGLTDRTVVAPVLKTTSLEDHGQNTISADENIYASRPIWNSWLNPYDKFGSKHDRDPEETENLIPTYTYTPLENLLTVVKDILKDDGLDEETLELCADFYSSSYYNFKNFLSERCSSDMMVSVLFEPVYNFKNIDHNYIVEVPLDGSSMPDNTYNQGTVMADMIMGKNIYDDLYDMRISRLGDFKRTRSYKSISQTGNQVFLTYFDDVGYSDGFSATKQYDRSYRDSKIDGLSSLYQISSSINSVEDVVEHRTLPPNFQDYMKVECLDAINRFVSMTLHKANLYSTKIYGLKEALNSKQTTDEQTRNIKENITNSIRRIVSNFTPAHTQYSTTVSYFDSMSGFYESC